MNENYYYMNPCALSFYILENNREYHPSDKFRFFRFVNTICNLYKTEGIKWHNKAFFEKECEKYAISSEEINYYYNILDAVISYKLVYKNATMFPKKKKPETVNKNCNNKYYQIGFYNGSVMELEITKEEFEKNGVGKRVFFERLKKDK